MQQSTVIIQATTDSIMLSDIKNVAQPTANAIAGLVSDDELSSDYILPAAFDERVGTAVAGAVADAAIRSGVARI